MIRWMFECWREGLRVGESVPWDRGELGALSGCQGHTVGWPQGCRESENLNGVSGCVGGTSDPWLLCSPLTYIRAPRSRPCMGQDLGFIKEVIPRQTGKGMGEWGIRTGKAEGADKAPQSTAPA